MALIRYVEDKLYQEALASPIATNLLRALFNSPEWAKAFVALGGVEMNKFVLPAADREIVILQTAAILDAGYVWAQHEGISDVAGISEVQRNAIKVGDHTNPIFSERQQALLKLVNRVATRHEGALIIEAKAQFTDQELLEIVGIHGFAYTVSSITSALLDRGGSRQRRGRPALRWSGRQIAKQWRQQRSWIKYDHGCLRISRDSRKRRLM